MTGLQQAPIGRPIAWKYIVGAAIAFPVLLTLWLTFDLKVWHPELMDVDVETTMEKMRWFGVPLAAVALLFGGNWVAASVKADARDREWQQKAQHLKEQEAAAHAGTARREYTLEVLGLGITVEKYRQGKLWDVLQKGSPFTSIREQDPKKYPWSETDKAGVTGARACDALENGANPSPMYWGVPSLAAMPPAPNPEYESTEIDPGSGLTDSADGTGMAWHLFVTATWVVGERPDQVLAKVFAFFDAHPDVPYVVLTAVDSAVLHDRFRAPGTPRMLKKGYFIPAMSDASAVFVLARRERVEPLRPYVWDDPDNNYLQENLRRMYIRLSETVPTKEKLADPEGKEHHISRQPTAAEWLVAAAAFAKKPFFKKEEAGITLPGFRPWTNDPPKDWKPTPWFPVPWNRNQMMAFDNLPSLGFIHRPVFVKFADEHGTPVTRRDARQHILEAGWQQALLTLPETQRAKGPARIIGAFADHVEQRLAFEGMLDRYAAQGGPEINTSKTAQFINTDLRFGNSGAATFFVQMGIGVMGSYLAGGTSAAINLRDPAGASIVFISPPTEERRQQQAGWDVFKNAVQPSIDPANYANP